MKSTADRQREWRKRQKEQGYQMLTVWLDPDVSEALKTAVMKSDTPQAERQKLINYALRKLLGVNPVTT